MSKEIKGRIVDEQGEALIGVNVSVNGGSTGTITDLNGDFAINVAQNDLLKVSYIGYTTQMVKVTDKTTYNITMKSDAKALDEVVVVGYGSVKKRDLTDLFHRFHLHRFRIRL